MTSRTLVVKKNSSVGELAQILSKLQKDDDAIRNIEATKDGEIKIFFKPSFDLTKDDFEEFKSARLCFSDTEATAQNSNHRIPVSNVTVVPWFARHISELDVISNNVHMYGKDLDANHPSFKDEAYRKRRVELGTIADNYRFGDPIQRIEYTKEEKDTWRTVYRELLKVYQTHACKECLENIPLLQKYAGYKEDDLPQLEDVSNFLKRKSGFTLRPVSGYISSKEFLQGLAYRVFYCTQYIRHHSEPFYTVEPDCVHELMGHVPLLADPAFAQYSQELGLASLGVSEEDADKIAKLYFFSVEFGICKEDGQLRAYGAGLLSSVSELKHALSDEAIRKPFIAEDVIEAECMVTTYQKAYFVSESFQEARDQLRKFVKNLQRPFGIRYNYIMDSVDVLDEPGKFKEVLADLQSEIATMEQALLQLSSRQDQKPALPWRMARPRKFQ